MNEFKKQVLDAINKHPGFTTNEYLADMLLDKSEKPKLARVLSELKKDGYVSSVMGEEKLLCWSLTPKGEAYVAENRKGLKFDVIPQAQHDPDDDAVKVDEVGLYNVVTKNGSFIPGYKTIDEAIEKCQALGGGEVVKVIQKTVAKVEPVTTYKVTRY